MSDDQHPAPAVNGESGEDEPADTARLPRRRLLQALGGAAGLASLGLSEAGPIDGVRAQASESGPWTQQQKLSATDGDSGDSFGGSVSLSDDGTTAIIGAYSDEDNAGSVYVFTESDGNWTQQQKLSASDGNFLDSFGWSVSMSGDGTTALIGARRDEDPNGRYAGSVYVFTESGGSWNQQQKLSASDGDLGDNFGDSVSVSGDGTTAVIGARADEDPNGQYAGSAYVFTESDGNWSQQQKLSANDIEPGEQYSQAFGSSVSLSDDGTTALIGAMLDDNPNGGSAGSAGSVYVFTQSDGGWSQQQKVISDDGDVSDKFGSSVSLSDDGTTALIGADGDKDLNGNSNRGSMYVFTESDGSWSQQQKLTPNGIKQGDSFGDSVSVSGDGETVIGGLDTDDPGSVYAFTESGGEWSQQQELGANDSDSIDLFGDSVSISGDETTALVGARVDNDAGSAYVFEASGPERGGGGQNSFDPAVHGFGFDNYRTPDIPSFENLLEVVNNTYSSTLNEINIADRFTKITVAAVVYTAFEGGLTNGHCLGMVFTAREYYNQGVPALPEYDSPVETTSDIILPDGETPDSVSTIEPVAKQINQRQQTQAFDSTYTLRYLATNFALSPGSEPGAVNHSAVLKAIKQAIEDGRTAPISLARSLTSGHQVLAYDITLEDPQFNEVETIDEARTVDVAVYDPNQKAGQYSGNEDFLSLDLLSFVRGTDNSFKMSGYETRGITYDRAMYVESVNPDYEFFTGSDSVDGFRKALSNGLANYLAVGVQSPVSLSIEGPAGESLRELDISEAALSSATEYEKLYFGTEISSGDYTIEVTGTGNGEYTVTVGGKTTDGGEIDDNYTGDISEGEQQQLSATLTDSEEKSGRIVAEADDDAVYDPGSVAGEYDSNGDGQITASELGDAVTDFGQGEVTASELGEVVTAFGQS